MLAEFDFKYDEPIICTAIHNGHELSEKVKENISFEILLLLIYQRILLSEKKTEFPQSNKVVLLTIYDSSRIDIL